MGEITEDHMIDSVAEALQYVSYFHPPDFIRAMARAYEREESPGARNAIAQILVNSRMAALGRRPICQDTGTANIFVKVGTRANLVEATSSSNRLFLKMVPCVATRAPSISDRLVHHIPTILTK